MGVSNLQCSSWGSARQAKLGLPGNRVGLKKELAHPPSLVVFSFLPWDAAGCKGRMLIAYVRFG